MDELLYADSTLPLYLREESLAEGSAHSDMAHRHEGVELLCVMKGELQCQTGLSRFSLQRGDLCFINRRQMHHISAPGEARSRQLVLIIGPGLLTQNREVYEKCLRPMLDDREFSHVRFSGGEGPAAELYRRMLSIRQILEEKPCGYELELIALAHQIFRWLYCAYVEKPRRQSLSAQAFVQQKMADYIAMHYGQPISLDDIARAGSVSRSQCSKLFKQYTGQSPVAFLNSYRLERSRELLRGSAETVSAVSQRCGFAEQSYFNRLFLREYGCTPLEYRRGGLAS